MEAHNIPDTITPAKAGVALWSNPWELSAERERLLAQRKGEVTGGEEWPYRILLEERHLLPNLAPPVIIVLIFNSKIESQMFISESQTY